MGKSVRYQFTLRWLLILATAIALAFAVAGGIGGPLWLRMSMGAYLAFELAGIVMRWPRIWQLSRRRRLAAPRGQGELAIEVAKQEPQRLEAPPNSAESRPNAESQ